MADPSIQELASAVNEASRNLRSVCDQLRRHNKPWTHLLLACEESEQAARAGLSQSWSMLDRMYRLAVEIQAERPDTHDGDIATQAAGPGAFDAGAGQVACAADECALLDWFDAHPDVIVRSRGYLGAAASWAWRDAEGAAHDAATLREAIRAAMAAHGGGGR